MYVADQIASLLKIFIYLTSFFAFLYAKQYIKERNINSGEYYVLGLFCVLGMSVLVSANSLLVIFLGVEILSLPLYAMVALERTSSICSEAAMKYYIMGAVATAMLLYGFSMLYGATNSIDVLTITQYITAPNFTNHLMIIFALVFVIAGLAFKLGAAPFHLWAPDVYQGAPTSVTLFIGSAPKIATLGMLIRLLVDAMPAIHVEWQQLLIIVALLSMAVGNIVAIVQTNIKRMLAYSSIAHMGYMSLGLLTATPDGYAAAMFYMIIYAIMSMAAFAVVVILSRAGFEAENIKDFRGLNSRNPWLALMMLLVMFSMAGIPPTVGFFAKLGVLEALVSAHYVWLAAIALVFAVIGAYYYLAIVKVMYFEEPVTHEPVVTKLDLRVAITVNSLAVLILGLFPTALINFCRAAFMI
jgi:NADH-quinone oxidoreductase subunit N